MSEMRKTKAQLVEELRVLRDRIAALEVGSLQGEDRGSSLARDSREPIFLSTPSGEFLDVNQAAADFFGCDREELMAMRASDLYADPRARKLFVEKIELEGSVKDHEMRVRRKDGEERICLESAVARRDPDGRTVAYQGILHDITDLRRVEAELRAHKDRLQELVDERTAALEDANARLMEELAERRRIERVLRLDEERLQALVRLGEKTGLKDVELVEYAIEECVRLTGSEVGYLHFVNPNQETLRLHTYSREVLKTCTAEKVGDYPVANAGVWADCLGLGEPVHHNDYENLPEKRGLPEGHFQVRRHMSVPISDGGKCVAIVGVGNKEEPYDGADAHQLTVFAGEMWKILSRRWMEEALGTSETRFRVLVENAPEAVFILDVETGTAPLFNEKALTLFGISREEMKKTCPWELSPEGQPDGTGSREGSDRLIQEALDGGTPVFDWTFRRPDGSEYVAEVRLACLPDPNRKLIRASMVDVTERRQTEEELEKIVNLSVDMICVADINGYFKKINPAFGKCLGYSDAELLGKPFLDFVHPGDVEQTLKVIREKLEKGETVLHFENRYRHKDGSYRWLKWSSRPVVEQGITYAIARDVTEEKEAAEKLRISEERYALAQRAAGIGSWDWNVLTGDLQWSEEIYRIFGLTPDEFPATYEAFLATIHPHDREDVVNAVKASVNDGEDYAIEHRVVWPDGTVRGVSEMGEVFRDEEGGPFRMVGLVQDITRRKEADEDLKASERRLSEAQRVGHVGSWELDLEDAALTWSDEVYRIFDLDPGEFGATYEAFLKAVHPDDREVVDRAFKASVENDARYDIVHRIVRPSGEVRWVRERAENTKNEDGETVRAMGVVHDITELKETEEALRQAKEASDDANRAKSAFLAHMSHEIRTPMNAILGYAQLMQRDPSLSSEQKENLEVINRSGEHLLHLINDVLEMSKIEAGRMTLKLDALDFHAMLEDLERMFRVRARAKDLTLDMVRDPGVPQMLRVDSSKLRQILINLLSNAVKFTEKGGVVCRVRLDRSNAQDLRLVMEVEDTGPGIAQEEMGRLFERFEQTAAGQQSQEGTGLGLPIAKRYSGLMGGDLTVTSEVGVGSTFRIEIQVQECEEDLFARTPLPWRVAGVCLAPGQDSVRILVVDDKESNRRFLARMLELDGMEVREAVNGEEAIVAFEEWKPHLVLMDSRMPVMDGYEATRRIKATPTGQRTPIIAVSASAMEEDRDVALTGGADGFLGKPFRESELFEMLRAHLRLEYKSAPEEGPREAKRDAAALTSSLRKALAGLPSALVQEIRRAVLTANPRRLKELVAEIDSEDGGLASTITDLADRFQWDFLLDLLPEDEGGS